MHEPIDLHDSRALVTGASGGIGGAVAVLLARCGAHCYVHYHSNNSRAEQIVDAIRSSGGSAEPIQADLQQTEGVQGLAGAIEEKGGVDILVNNAGIINDMLIVDMDLDDFEKVQRVNLSAPFLLSRQIGMGMIRRAGGKIVNISSTSARRCGQGQANYAAAKAGLEAFTRAAAIEFGPFGINVNAVAPGITRTAMTEAYWEGFEQRLKRKVPLRRFAEPDDVASTVLFLASPMAAYITGQTLTVDGGLCLTVK